MLGYPNLEKTQINLTAPRGGCLGSYKGPKANEQKQVTTVTNEQNGRERAQGCSLEMKR